MESKRKEKLNKKNWDTLDISREGINLVKESRIIFSLIHMNCFKMESDESIKDIYI